MRRLTAAETRAFLREGTRTAKVAITRRDGSPLVAPVWFAVDDDDSIVFNTHTDTAKARNLRRDGRVALCVDDQTPPFASVQVYGRAELSADADEVRRWATIIGGRYMGADRAEEFGRRNGGPGELLVRIRPERTIAVADVAGY